MKRVSGSISVLGKWPICSSISDNCRLGCFERALAVGVVTLVSGRLGGVFGGRGR